jgi:hypothetical protein
MKEFRVELKVCEGCGGLWLCARETEAERRGAYCSSCVQWLAEFPAPKRGQARGEAQRKRRQRSRQRNSAARAAAEVGTVVDVKASEMELVGVGGEKCGQ